MMPNASMPFAVLLSLSVAACGSSVVQQGGGDQGGEAAGGGGGGQGGACGGFEDEAGSGTLTLRFVNDDFVPMYIPGNCENLDYQLVPTGDDAARYPFDASCLLTCEELQTEPQIYCGACQPLVYRIDPGASFDVTWDGTGLLDRTMPQACFFESSGGTSCSQIVSAPAGSYGVSVQASSECIDCDCTGTGPCIGSVGGFAASPTPTVVSFPEAGLVEVHWPECSFGCPL